MGLLNNKSYYKLTVKITALEEILGSTASDPEIMKRFIASGAPEAAMTDEEVAAIKAREEQLKAKLEENGEDFDEAQERSMTVFPRTEDGVPFCWDYQWKGFFKDACGMLRKVPGSESSKVKAFKKIIDGIIFVGPRQIPFDFDGECGICVRPLRAQTPQGERIALAASETVPAGTTMTFTIVDISGGQYAKLIKEWLDYGELRGFSQWRNSGKGRFTYEIVEEYKPKKKKAAEGDEE